MKFSGKREVYYWLGLFLLASMMTVVTAVRGEWQYQIAFGVCASYGWYYLYKTVSERES